MSTFDNAVSICPYFKIQEGQMDACKGFLAQFCELVKKEEKCLYYNFTMKGDILRCREAYRDSDGVLAHLENCGSALEKFLEIADLQRIELHGPAAELEKLKETFAAFNPDYFVCECGIGN
jgi:hypothetical protein